MKCSAFINSLKFQNKKYRSVAISTTNEFISLEDKYKELQERAVPIFRKQTEPDVFLSERRKAREERRALQQTVSTRKEEHEKQQHQQPQKEQEADAAQNDERKYAPGPCRVTHFVAEKYTPFNAYARNIRMSKTYGPSNKKTKKRPYSAV